MKNNNNIKINGLALKKEFENKNLVLDKCSVEIGYGHSFLSNCINMNQINKPASILLKQLYDIDVTQLPQEESKQIEAQYIKRSELESIVYEAVKRAILEVRNG